MSLLALPLFSSLQFILELQTYSPAWAPLVNTMYLKTGFDP